MLEKFSLSGQVALISGGGRGIGRAIALALAEAGAEVALASRTVAEIEQVASEIEQLGRRSLAQRADVADPAQIKTLVTQVLERFGQIDILVNNAGISPVFKPMAEVTLAEWDQVLGVNLRGAFLLSQEIGRAMIRQGRGSIINIASIAGMRGVSHIGAYAVSKAGLIQLTRVLATEWAAQGIRVNAIAPGWVETAMTQPVMAQAELYQGLLATIPQKRFAAPEEIAGLAVYLASEAASFVTGQVYVADGGQTI